jgi:hypothetical protein
MVQLMYNHVRYLTDLEKSPVKQAVVEGNGVTCKLHPQLKISLVLGWQFWDFRQQEGVRGCDRNV